MDSPSNDNSENGSIPDSVDDTSSQPHRPTHRRGRSQSLGTKDERENILRVFSLINPASRHGDRNPDSRRTSISSTLSIENYLDSISVDIPVFFDKDYLRDYFLVKILTAFHSSLFFMKLSGASEFEWTAHLISRIIFIIEEVINGSISFLNLTYLTNSYKEVAKEIEGFKNHLNSLEKNHQEIEPCRDGINNIFEKHYAEKQFIIYHTISSVLQMLAATCGITAAFEMHPSEYSQIVLPAFGAKVTTLALSNLVDMKLSRLENLFQDDTNDGWMARLSCCFSSKSFRFLCNTATSFLISYICITEENLNSENAYLSLTICASLSACTGLLLAWQKRHEIKNHLKGYAENRHSFFCARRLTSDALSLLPATASVINDPSSTNYNSFNTTSSDKNQQSNISGWCNII